MLKKSYEIKVLNKKKLWHGFGFLLFVFRKRNLKTEFLNFKI